MRIISSVFFKNGGKKLVKKLGWDRGFARKREIAGLRKKKTSGKAGFENPIVDPHSRSSPATPILSVEVTDTKDILETDGPTIAELKL